MDAGALHVLHNAGDQHPFAVADGVHLALAPLHVVVHQHLALRRDLGGDGQIADQFRGIAHDFHGPPPQHVAGTNDHRVADALGHGQGLVHRLHRTPGRLRDAQIHQEPLELLPVAGDVDGLGAGTQDGQPDSGQGLGQVDRSLAAELHQAGRRVVVHRLVVDDVADGLLVQRLEIQAVAGVKVGGYGFGIGVDHDAGHAGLGERPGGVYAAIIELDALPNANGTAADDDGLGAGQRRRFVLRVVGTVVVGCRGLKLGGAGVHHLEHGLDVVAQPQLAHLLGQKAGQGGDFHIGKSQPLGCQQHRRRQRIAQQAAFLVNDALQRGDEPGIDAGARHQLIAGYSSAQGG